MVDIPSCLALYTDRDGCKSKIIDDAPEDIIDIAKRTDELYYSIHLKHMFSNFENNKTDLNK